MTSVVHSLADPGAYLSRRCSLLEVSDEELFDLSAAGLRADGADVRMSVELLAGKLEAALPGRTSVQRGGGGLLGRGHKHVRQIAVKLGSNSYRLAVQDEQVSGYRDCEVGGVSIKRETLSPQEWVTALTEDLRTESEQSAEARAALERLVG